MKHILGIDVGGTKIAAGLVDKSYRVTKAKVLPTSQINLTKQLIKLIESYKDFDAIGLALPGPVPPTGFVSKLPNVKNYKPTNFKKLLGSKFKAPVNVINDAKAFTLAEAIIGSGRNYKTVVGVILGTGIGSGWVRKKKIYHAKNPAAGEIGHMLIGNNLTLEQLMQQTKKDFKTPKHAERIVRIILSTIFAANPDVIIFGGGRTNYPGLQGILKHSLKSTMNRQAKTLVKISKLKHAGIIGAALPLLKK